MKTGCKALVCDVEAVAYVNCLSTLADEGADEVDEGFVSYLAVVERQINVLADFGDELRSLDQWSEMERRRISW